MISHNQTLLQPIELLNEVEAEYAKVTFNLIRFKFLNDHLNIRPGKSHLLLGTAGKGKSTLAQSILRDCIRDNVVALYDTENTMKDLIYLYSKKSLSRVERSRLHVLTEDELLRDIPISNPDAWLDRLVDFTLLTKSKALFFDNITTSAYYAEKHPSEQTRIWYELQKRIRKHNIPFFGVAHTASSVRDDQVMVSPEDIRGVKTPAIKSEYCYTFQRITVLEARQGYELHRIKHDLDSAGLIEKIFSFVRVVKSRMGDNSMCTYSLGFDVKTKEYYIDKKMENRHVKAMIAAKV